ncbi:MAG TPA: filamentous hemagglutinin N-terminal domain-containing protein, partial [Nevskiaceae bacterium]|nr:filamentous hemagglutinin N-terminal domain-containing protein [Nevskiaceae bacterium]
MNKFELTAISRSLIARRWHVGLLPLVAPALVLANPSGGQVTAGSAAITTPNSATTVINQASDAAIIQWQSFNVGRQEYVIFNQPTASAAVLNRVVGGDASLILGHMESNGRVFLINPMGVLFGKGAQVNVGSLVASTLDLADGDFLQGKYVFQSAPGSTPAGVVNEGRIVAGQGGYVVLAGDYVKNAGVITAKLGDIALASGSAATLDMNGDGLVNFAVSKAALSDRAGVDNIGKLVADGGTVVMTAQVARELMHAAV